MAEKNFVVLYNPKNAPALTAEQIEAMQLLAYDEIEALAKQYPNTAIQVAYLVLKDTTKPDKDQLFPLSTWQNLRDLHRQGQKQFVAFGFNRNFQRSTMKLMPVQDLTQEEIENAEGLKRILEEENKNLVPGQPGTTNSGEENGIPEIQDLTDQPDLPGENAADATNFVFPDDIDKIEPSQEESFPEGIEEQPVRPKRRYTKRTPGN